MDAALRLGDRHPLHAVHATLVLEAGPCTVAPDEERDLGESAHVGVTGLERFALPAVDDGEGHVHVVEVAGEEVGLLTALGATDLNDHVAAVVRIAGQQQQPEPLLKVGDRGLQVGDLGPEFLALITFGLVNHLPRGPEVVVCLTEWSTDDEDLLEFLEPPAHGPEQVLVAQDLGVGQAPPGLRQLGLEGLDSLQHAAQGSGGVPPP